MRIAAKRMNSTVATTAEAAPQWRLCTRGRSYYVMDRSGEESALEPGFVSWLTSKHKSEVRLCRAFTPYAIMEAYFKNILEEQDFPTEKVEHQPEVHSGLATVVCCSTHGFSQLAGRLEMNSSGAELLSQCLQAFFTPLIDIIHSYRGDVISFSGDKLMIYFAAVDDIATDTKKRIVPPHGSYGLPDLGPVRTASLRAAAACVEIHKRLGNFDTGVDDIRLQLTIGVGAGMVKILEVGGETPPDTNIPYFDYFMVGEPMQQVAIAEPLAKAGETCMSSQVWEHVKECVHEDLRRKLEDRPDCHLLLKMDEKQYTFPTIKHAAMLRDRRHEFNFTHSELNTIRKYIPSAVYKQIKDGTLEYVNEMRYVTTIFFTCAGVDGNLAEGANTLQDIMVEMQKICYDHEGTMNKFIMDEKGLLCLMVYGLPPIVHTDAPTRAVLACLELVKCMRLRGLGGRFGVATGKAYCGLSGSANRMEYTVLGESVNLARRFMECAAPDSIMVDDATRNASSNDITYTELEPMEICGKAEPVNVHAPSRSGASSRIGLLPDGTFHAPWYSVPMGGISQLAKGSVSENMEMIRQNMVHLCKLSDWKGIKKLQELLGRPFSPEAYDGGALGSVTLSKGKPSAEGSPFLSGSAIVIEGKAGLGKIELAEHAIISAARNLGALPVFGSMGPRPDDPERLGVELLRSVAGIYRYLDRTLPDDDLALLQKMMSAREIAGAAEVAQGLQENAMENATREQRMELLSSLTDVAVELLEDVRSKTTILVVLQLETGNALYKRTKECFGNFWDVVDKIADVTLEQEMVAFLTGKSVTPDKLDMQGRHPATMLIVASEAKRDNAVVEMALQNDRVIELAGLSPESSTEYMAAFLNVPRSSLPDPLAEFVQCISLGNPLYIRESLSQLKSLGHLQVVAGNLGLCVEYEQDLEGINVTEWATTTMVGETLCLLESLDPLPAAVLKTGCCFGGKFTMSDLASTLCSHWSGATQFDRLRLYSAVRQLVRRGFFEHTAPLEVTWTLKDANAQDQNHTQTFECFKLRDVLVKKVGASMLLEKQKLSIKRQALIDRVLSRELPRRMEQVLNEENLTHIPWYYEDVLTRPSIITPSSYAPVPLSSTSSKATLTSA
eukprot:TRINITY_DN3084_c0_g4_i1.p1 TRINITY_DN3084_c0_g4~~TRINITY_DN3084_c0_g4_i1.p1  ORF type:complete len:1123 (-),score=247.59 TRINITY_DN3084_c0_g4_i1:427-3795(-)